MSKLNVKVRSCCKLEGDRSKVRLNKRIAVARLLLSAQAERANTDFAIMSGGGVRDSI